MNYDYFSNKNKYIFNKEQRKFMLNLMDLSFQDYQTNFIVEFIMLSYAKGSNVDQGYGVIIENEYEINGLFFNINGIFNF